METSSSGWASRVAAISSLLEKLASAPSRIVASNWPVAALMAAEVAAEVEKQTNKPVMIEAAILQRVLETHVREQLSALADLRVSLG